MSVYRQPNGRWVYDFILRGRRCVYGGFASREEAAEAEATKRRTIRRQAAGLEPLDAADTPKFSDWAAVTLKFQRERKEIKRPDQAKLTLRMILAFWGTKPEDERHIVKGGLYKNLRLGDPIQNPTLIHEFETWMAARGISGARKNHYRSACSMLYRVALQPENRLRSGIRENPFRDIMRDRVRRRTRVLEPDDITRWIQTASLPAVVAVALGALAPALRLANVIELRRDQLSPARDFLTVPHKTDRETGLPLTVAISSGLRTILAEVERLYPEDPYVVPALKRLPRRGKHAKGPVRTGRLAPMQRELKRSIKLAGLPYGRIAANGVTFHSLRHALHTWMARQGLTADVRQRAMGQTTAAMANWYTHLAGADTVDTMELISDRTTIAGAALARIQALSTAAVQKDVGKKSRQIPMKTVRPTDFFDRSKRKQA